MGDNRVRTIVIAGAVVAVVTLAGCGGGGSETGQTLTAGDSRETEFDRLAQAVEGAKVAICEPEEHSGFIPLPAPAEPAARDFSYFRYVEGRIYEFGPCQLPPGARNELRAYRYDDTATRDQALTDVSRRNTRPTSTFAFEDLYAVEIWSPEPSMDSPAGQAAAQVHSAMSRVPQARHHDVPTAASVNCPPVAAASATPTADGAVPVAIPAFLFCPADLSVAAGTEVRWTNSDVAPHTATAAGTEAAFDSGTLDTGQTFTFRFDRPGAYEYFCRLHPNMRGTITVT